MADPKDRLDVHVNVEITAGALSSIVENAKALAGANKRGFYQVDTAAMVGRMISEFLARNDFEAFVRDIDNYTFPED